MPTETEIKLRLHEPARILAKLDQLGYQPGPRTLEIDQVYDRPDAELKLSRRLIRLRRRDDRWTLTYKGPPVEGRHKSREEIETDLSDGPAFEQILAALGYVPTFRYEKYRTTYRSDETGGIVTLDETPIGDFLELEGEGDWIDRTALQLGFAHADYLTASYASLYQEYRLLHPQVPEHMRF